MYGYAYRYSGRPNGVLAFNPLTDIDGLSLYLNKNTNVNTKIAADFVAANSEYLSSTSTDFDKGNESFSFGGWFYFDDTNTQRVIGQYTSITNRSYVIYKDATNVAMILSNDGTAQTTTTGGTYSTSSWVFIIGVYDSVNDLQKLSVNGSDFVTTANSSGAYSSGTADFEISNSNSIPFDGRADAIPFYDKALSLAEVTALYNLGNGTSYPSLEDLNGNTYAIGQAFNGTDNGFNLDALITPLGSTTEGYIECVINVPTIGASEAIFTVGDTDAVTDLRFNVQAGGTLRGFCRIAGTIYWNFESTNVIVAGTDTTIALKHNGTTPSIYINDVLETSVWTTTTDKTKWITDGAFDNIRLGCTNLNNNGNAEWGELYVQNLKIWSDATQTTQVADYLLNNVEGADQVDTIGAYNGTPIGTPVSTIASVDNTTIATIESSLVLWADLNEESGTRFDSSGNGNDLTDNNTVGYALGKVQDTSTVGERVWNWIDQSSNAYIFSNDTVTAQPLLETNDIVFDGTDDVLDKTIADVYSGDSSGIIFFSGYFDNSVTNYVIGSGDIGTVNYYLYIRISTAGIWEIGVKDGTTQDRVTTTNAIANGAFYYGYIKSTGTAYELSLNGVIETPIVAAGTNRGHWFADISLRDNLSIGSLIRTSVLNSVAKVNKVIYSNAALTDSRIAQVNTFMSNPDN